MQQFIDRGQKNIILIILEPHSKIEITKYLRDLCRFCCEAERTLVYLR